MTQYPTESASPVAGLDSTQSRMTLHRRLIQISLSLYLVATWTSIAGMEIFGWLTFVLTMSYAFRKPADSPASLGELFSFLPWKAMLGLYLVTIVGIFVNGSPEADKVFIIGSQRWIILLISTSFALFLAPPTLRGYRLFLFVMAVVAGYAIFQSFTGIDLLRPGSHRAVQPLAVRQEISLWRSAGLFGSPMHYVYIVGQHVCLPLAVFFVFPKTAQRLRWISLAVFALTAASLITTYVRGGWIAMAAAYLVMAWLASRKIFLWVAASGAAAFTALFIGLVQFRERLLSLFDSKYTSNSDRLNLWKMNWEMFKDYPFLGIGWEENETRACEYVNCNAIPKPFTGHAHNNYIQALSGMGIVGFVSYMVFIGFFLWLTVRLWNRLPKELYWARALTLACLGAQVQLHIGGFTECNFKAGATNHNFMVVLGLVAAMSLMEAKGLIGKTFATKNLANWPRA